MIAGLSMASVVDTEEALSGPLDNEKCLGLIQRAGQRLFRIDHTRHRQPGYHRLTPGQELTQLLKRCALQLQRSEVPQERIHCRVSPNQQA